MSAPIITHYEALARAREARSHTLVAPASLTSEFDRATADAAAKIGALLESAAFFRTFDYRWAADPTSYRNPLEAALQRMVLTAICEIEPSHPHYPRLGDICVRVAPSGGVNAMSFEDEGFKYAVMTTALVKYPWEFLHVFDTLRPRASRYDEIPGFNAAAAAWTPADAAGCAAEQGEALDQLFDTALSYTDFTVPEHLESRYNSVTERNSPRAAYMTQTIGAADAFIVLHEVGHLLAHPGPATQRDERIEIQADEAALSLMIILSSREPTITPYLMNGPALSFAAMRHFNMCRRTGFHLKSITKKDESFDEEAERRFEQELTDRSCRISRMAASMGLPRLLAKSFDTISQEMFFLTEATKLRLIARLGPKS